MEYRKTFQLKDGMIAKVSGVYAIGFYYHTFNSDGDCVEGEKYMTHEEFNLLQPTIN